MAGKRTRGPDVLPRRAWTAEDNDLLRAMVTAKASRREVAAALGRSEGAVRIQSMKLGTRFCPEAARALAEASMAAVRADPRYRAKLGVSVSAAWTPERRARTSDRCTRLQLWRAGQAVLASDPDAAARRSAAARINMAAHRRDALAWCPPAWRDRYVAASYKLRSAGEARAMIEAEIAVEAARAERTAAADREAAWVAARDAMMRGGGRRVQAARVMEPGDARD